MPPPSSKCGLKNWRLLPTSWKAQVKGCMDDGVCVMLCIMLCVMSCMMLCVMLCGDIVCDVLCGVVCDGVCDGVCYVVCDGVSGERCCVCWCGGMIDFMLFWGFAFRQTNKWTDEHWCFLSHVRNWKTCTTKNFSSLDPIFTELWMPKLLTYVQQTIIVVSP